MRIKLSEYAKDNSILIVKKISESGVTRCNSKLADERIAEDKRFKGYISLKSKNCIARD